MRTLILIFSLLGLLQGCTDKPQKPSVFKASLGPEPSSYDWHTTRDIIAIGVIYNTMEGLFSYDLSQQTIKVIPQLAESYWTDPQFQTWRFKLKKDVYWSNGTRLKAADFINAWKRLLTSSTGSPHSQRFFVIKKAQLYYQGKVPFSEVGLQALNDKEIEIKLETPFPDLPKLLTGFFSFPMQLSQNNLNPTLITLGPYTRLKTSNQQTCLQAHKKYHSKKPEVKNVCLLWLENKKTALRLFAKGDLDFVKSPNKEDVIASHLLSDYKTGPTHGLYFLGFNLKKPPTDDRNFRKKVKDSLDKSSLEKVANENFDRSDSLYPQSIFSSNIKKNLPPQEKQIFNNQVIHIGSNQTDLNKKILSHLSQQLKSKGLKNAIKLLENKTYTELLKSHENFHIFRKSWTPALVTPHAYAELFVSDSPNNFTGYNNPQYDTWVKKAQSLSFETSRHSLYKKIENQILTKDIVAIPLFTHKQSFLIRTKKYDLFPHPTERVDFIYLKKK